MSVYRVRMNSRGGRKVTPNLLYLLVCQLSGGIHSPKFECFLGFAVSHTTPEERAAQDE